MSNVNMKEPDYRSWPLKKPQLLNLQAYTCSDIMEQPQEKKKKFKFTSSRCQNVNMKESDYRNWPLNNPQLLTFTLNL